MNHSDGAVTLLVMTLLSVLALGVFALGDPISVTEPVYPIGALAGGSDVRALEWTIEMFWTVLPKHGKGWRLREKALAKMLRLAKTGDEGP